MIKARSKIDPAVWLKYVKYIAGVILLASLFSLQKEYWMPARVPS